MNESHYICKIQKQAAQIRRLREALEWYADDANYCEESSRHDSCAVMENMGEKARAALQEPQ